MFYVQYVDFDERRKVLYMKNDRLSELAVGLSGLSYSEWKQLCFFILFCMPDKEVD